MCVMVAGVVCQVTVVVFMLHVLLLLLPERLVIIDESPRLNLVWCADKFVKER